MEGPEVGGRALTRGVEPEVVGRAQHSSEEGWSWVALAASALTASGFIARQRSQDRSQGIRIAIGDVFRFFLPSLPVCTIINISYLQDLSEAWSEGRQQKTSQYSGRTVTQELGHQIKKANSRSRTLSQRPKENHRSPVFRLLMKSYDPIIRAITPSSRPPDPQTPLG
ncbi:hypothetical protein AVEN_71896-1 [Araneus ventricosus]|uniref:Uncharacterized protein n=1 Tax=Araneus ventricosus TaxID=182803 RepID=A0A4Y2MTB0_ARAVE|nr:hypothetical protein AVEN_140185-1 [Araneus ventricosus]GBN29631.1 hypothetical protein AVEN_71896-1 [Araneus ventricosus]